MNVIERLLPDIGYVFAVIVFIVGLWVLLGFPVWTWRYFFGGLLLTIGVHWMIETTIRSPR